MPPQPSIRKLVGAALILLIITILAILVASLSRFVETWPVSAQAFFYLVAGIVWIVPLRPFIRWIETGHLRAKPPRLD
jgi:O-antigen/teichoic acid export membrane protein